MRDLKLPRVLLLLLISGATLLAAVEQPCNQTPCPGCEFFPSNGYFSPIVAVAGMLIQFFQIRSRRSAK